MTGDVAIKILGGYIGDAVNISHGQIDYASAVGADEMVMGAGIGIKVIDPIAQSQPLNLTDVCQESQVAVNSTKTDVGIQLSHIHVDNICRGVVMSTH